MLTKNIKLNMKNINQIFKYGLLAISSVLIFSCDSDDDDVPYVVGNSLATLEESEISFFDVNTTLNVSIADLSTTTALSNLEVFEDGEKLGDGLVADELSGTFNSSILPFEKLDDDNTGTFNLSIVSTEANGEVGASPVSLDVVSPLIVTNELGSIVFGDFTVDEDLATIGFETFTVNAEIDDIILSWKNGSEGVYEEVTVEEVTTAGVSINLNELSYINDFGLVANDTLFYQVTVTSGLLTESAETSVAILPQTFDVENVISLNSSSTTEYVLQTSEESEAGEIFFTGPQGFSTIDAVIAAPGVEAVEGVQFVKLADTGLEFFTEYTDLTTAKVDFEAGTPINTTQVLVDEVYVYRATRTINEVSVDVYGAILVGDVTTTIVNGVEEVVFDLQVKENFLFE